MFVGVLTTVLLGSHTPVLSASEAIVVGYIGQQRERPPALSNLDTYPQDEGLAGAKLGIADNNSTGKFTGQTFTLDQRYLSLQENVVEAVDQMLSSGVQFFILDLTTESLVTLLQTFPRSGAVFFNVAAEDRQFRDEQCHPALLHTALSRDMRADALAQFLVKKRWQEWFVVTGPRPEDKLFESAVLRAAKKFGAKVVEKKTWDGDFDARRSAQAEVPLFTKGADYDVLIVADEIGDFGNHLMFQTFDPRPVAGTQGLTAKAWGRPIEQWGATQLQERFLAQSDRWMLPRDYAAWLAARAVGEAAQRTDSSDYAEIEPFIRSADFQLAGFKGRKMSFRSWNGQLRQPVPLMWADALVAQTPVEGYLHQRTELDTLGLDLPESRCRLTR